MPIFSISLFMQGIPIIYYGTEQGFTGAVDPDNRESLWPHYDTEHWLYVFISTIAKFRVKLGAEVYDAPQVERYVDDEFFAFSRGDVSDVHQDDDKLNVVISVAWCSHTMHACTGS